MLSPAIWASLPAFLPAPPPPPLQAAGPKTWGGGCWREPGCPVPLGAGCTGKASPEQPQQRSAGRFPVSQQGWRAASAAVSAERSVQLAAPALALVPVDMGWQHAVSPRHRGALRRDPQAARGCPASALEGRPGLAPGPSVPSPPGIRGLEEGPFPTHPPAVPLGGTATVCRLNQAWPPGCART